MRELSTNTHDPRALFKALQEKPSRRTITAIYDQYGSVIKRYLHTHLEEDEDVQDALSEVFAKIWKQRKFLADKDEPLAWVLRIARNTAIDQFRQKTTFNWVSFENNELLIEVRTQQTELEYLDMEQLVLRAANQLPQKEKEVFLLSAIDGLTNKQISEQQHITEQTARNQLHRAVLKIRRYVADRLHFILF